MKLLRSTSSSSSGALQLLPVMFVAATAITSTLALLQTPLSSRIKTTTRTRTRTRTALASSSNRRREDVEDQVLSITNRWKNKKNNNNNNSDDVYLSDIPTENNKNSVDANVPNANFLTNFKDKFLKQLPPPPEDKFIMTGDIAILFLYAFTSHSLNDAIVKGVLENPLMTIPEAVQELDPLHDMVNLQHPVWVDLAGTNPYMPFGNPALDHALDVSARESLLNHWGPLLSTEGSACVALCTCWLVAGYFHRAFLYDNASYCGSGAALLKTVETWVTTALLLALCSAGTNLLVEHVPVLQSWFSVNGDLIGQPLSLLWTSLTQSDVLFIVDSLTVLIAWRWSANRIQNIMNN